VIGYCFYLYACRRQRIKTGTNTKKAAQGEAAFYIGDGGSIEL
jgi:hypothetical protein